MKYKLKNGKEINIPEDEIANNMKGLDLTREEAIEVWLEDNEYEVNEEQEALNTKAKAVKIKHGAAAETRKERKPVERKEDTEKEQLIDTIWQAVAALEDVHNVQVVNKGKLITNKVNTVNIIRPVIALKGNIKVVSGDGSIDNPYRV